MRILLSSFFMLYSLSGFSQIATAENAPSIQWHHWSQDTFQLAKEKDKLILLDISAEWCQFCKKMKAVTYKNPEVIDIINKNYIAITADIENTHDIKLLYGSFGVPGTVILTADKKELNKRLGYIAPQQMQWHLLGNLQDAP